MLFANIRLYEAGRFFAAIGGYYRSKMQAAGQQTTKFARGKRIDDWSCLRQDALRDSGRQAGIRNALSTVLSSVLPSVKDVFRA